jgi:FkbM family methyltransferase
MDQHFGELTTRQAAGEQSGLCALGLEPNPEHQERLHALEEAYSNKGWRVHFYPFAAWDSEGEMPLNTTSARPMSETDIFHRGAHLSMNLAEGQPVLASSLVRTVNLANFIDSLPQHSVSLALMDIEGAEYETLAQLMMEKKLCQSTILNLLVEAHEWGDIAKWGEPTSFSQGVHPRSTMAIGERLSQMAAMGWCPEGDGVTYVAKLDDFSYASDVDDNFGTR